MKIALVTDWFAPRRGGIESQLLGLAQALTTAGAQVSVITSLPGPGTVEGVHVVRLNCPLLPAVDVAVPWQLKTMVGQALRDGGFDIAHVHPSIVAPVCLAGVQSARALGLPALVTFHSSMRSLPFALQAANKVFHWASGSVVLSGVSRSIAAQISRIDPAHQPLVLPNGFDHEFWSDGPPVQPRAEGEPFRIATAMRLQATKRPLALLKVFADARKLAARHDVDLHLTIAGDGSYASMMKRKASRMGLGGSVEFAGWMDRAQLRTLYYRSQAFFLPSTKEAFGIAGLEARACGLPVIARAGTGTSDYLEHGRDGFLTTCDSAMAQGLAQLAVQPESWAQFAGRRPALSRFGWTEIAHRHLEVYESLASKA